MILSNSFNLNEHSDFDFIEKPFEYKVKYCSSDGVIGSSTLIRMEHIDEGFVWCLVMNYVTQLENNDKSLKIPITPQYLCKLLFQHKEGKLDNFFKFELPETYKAHTSSLVLKLHIVLPHNDDNMPETCVSFFMEPTEIPDNDRFNKKIMKLRENLMAECMAECDGKMNVFLNKTKTFIEKKIKPVELIKNNELLKYENNNLKTELETLKHKNNNFENEFDFLKNEIILLRHALNNNYATKRELNDNIDRIESFHNGIINTLDICATKSDLNKYITKSDSDKHITKNEFSNELIKCATKEELNGMTDRINSISEFVTINDLAKYATKSEINNVLAEYAIKNELTKYVTKTELNNELTKYATNIIIKDELNKYVAETVIKDELTKYVTKPEINNELTKYATKTEINNELTRYATKTEINNELAKYAANRTQTSVLVTYLVKDELAKCATKTEVNDSLVKCTDAIKDELTKYATKTELTNEFTKITRAIEAGIDSCVSRDELLKYVTKTELADHVTKTK
jgi:hypothetical protein